MKSSKHFLILCLISFLILSIYWYINFKITLRIYPDYFIESLNKIYFESGEVIPHIFLRAFGKNRFFFFIPIFVFSTFLTFSSALYSKTEVSNFKYLLKILLILNLVTIAFSVTFGITGYLLSIKFKINVPENFNEGVVQLSPNIFDAMNFYNFSVAGFLISACFLIFYKFKTRM